MALAWDWPRPWIGVCGRRCLGFCHIGYWRPVDIVIDLCGVVLGFGFAVKCASRVVLCVLCVCVLLLFWLAVLW